MCAPLPTRGKGAYAALPPSRQALFASLLPKVPLDFRALIDDPLRACDYGQVDVPACLIAGRSSPPCAHAIASILAASLAGAEMHEIDAGHMAPVSHPALVNPIIEDFVHRVDGRNENRARNAADLARSHSVSAQDVAVTCQI